MMFAMPPLQYQRLATQASVEKGEGCEPASSAPLGLQEIKQGKLLISSLSRQQKRRLNLEVELAKINCALWPTESGTYIVLLTEQKYSKGCNQ